MDMDLPKVEDVITAMLKENTGSHFLDSGGAYGRHWQANQKIESFSEKPASVLEYHHGTGEILVMKDIYHYMVDVLLVTEKSQLLQDEFLRFAKQEDERAGHSVCWYELYDEFPKHLNAIRFMDHTDWRISDGANSYNWESMISQVYQYRNLHWESEGTDYESIIILEIHGGCDVRGGYTDPKFFEMRGDAAYIRVEDSDYTVYIGKRMFYTDDGYNWYEDGNCCHNGRDELPELIRETILTGQVPGICKPEDIDIEYAVRFPSDELHGIRIPYHHRSDDCHTLNEYGVQS
jgi:hypothetical protein